MSLSTVEIDHEWVNCDTASEIGMTCMKKIVTLTFERIRVHLKRMNEVSKLASINCSTQVGDKNIKVDPLTLF